MPRGWYGYLVRALNEVALITAQCGTTEIPRQLQSATKAAAENRSPQRRQKKICSTAVKRRSR